MHFKDAILDRLAESANVAQFVSFGPDLEQRFARIHGYAPNHRFQSPLEAIRALLEASPEQSVNIRSFSPVDPKSREFIYGQKDASVVEGQIQRLASEGLHTIVNETVNTDDGGVSGVALDDIVEFAPKDTPRCVEKPGTAAFPRALGIQILEKVYGFTPKLDYGTGVRVEFSIHPLRRGFRHEHTIIWELEDVGPSRAEVDIRWPNRFSKHVGDKAFGLLVADVLGFPVPESLVIGREVPPFRFGRSTGCAETWLRTSPTVQVPGKFTTMRGWTDPFELLAAEDPDGDSVASIIAQAGIDAQYSGALVVSEGADGTEEVTIEGTRGYGEHFMTGQKRPTELPQDVLERVRGLHERVREKLGAVRFEWVMDRDTVWIVQLHRGLTKSHDRMIYPGKPKSVVRFAVADGLEALRALTDEVRGKDIGIVLVGEVGITSHLGDVLRQAQIPSWIEPSTAAPTVPA